MPPKRRRMTKKPPTPTGVDYTARLPDEVLSAVFDYGDQRLLVRRAARICRRWRTVATAHPLHYAYIALRPMKSHYRRRIDGFADSVRRAAAAGFRLSLDIHVHVTYDDQAAKHHEPLDASDVCFFVQDIVLGAVAECMPSVVALVVRLPGSSAAALSALRVPAPLLQRFTLTVGNGRRLHALPADVFDTTAPVLRTVQLSGIALSTAFPAFFNARDVQLDVFPASSLALLPQTFPALSSLELTGVDCRSWDGQPAVPLALGPLRSLELSFAAHPTEAMCGHLALTLGASTIPYITVHVARIPSSSLLDIPPPLRIAFTIAADEQADDASARRWTNEFHTVLQVRSLRNDFCRTLRVRNALSDDVFSVLQEHAADAHELVVSDVLLAPIFAQPVHLAALVRLTVDFDCPIPGTYTVWTDMALRDAVVTAPMLDTVTLRCTKPWGWKVAREDVDVLLRRFAP